MNRHQQMVTTSHPSNVWRFLAMFGPNIRNQSRRPEERPTWLVSCFPSQEHPKRNLATHSTLPGVVAHCSQNLGQVARRRRPTVAVFWISTKAPIFVSSPISQLQDHTRRGLSGLHVRYVAGRCTLSHTAFAPTTALYCGGAINGLPQTVSGLFRHRSDPH